MDIKNLVKPKAFIIGFLSGLLLFVYFNYSSVQDPSFMYSVGFPFHFYQEGGFISIKRFIWGGFLADIAIAIIFSFLLGLIFKFVRSKISAGKVK